MRNGKKEIKLMKEYYKKRLKSKMNYENKNEEKKWTEKRRFKIKKEEFITINAERKESK